MTTRSIRCNSCNAPLEVVPPDARTLKCTFCGMENALEILEPAAPPAVVVRTRVRTPLVVFLVPAFLVLLGVFIAIGTAGRSSTSRASSSSVQWSVPGLKAHQSRLDVPMGPANLYWMDQYVSPVPVDANGDGVEDIAGAFILDERNSLNAYVGVIDGRTWSVLWKDGPFGNREKATRSTGVGVREGRMLAVNALGDGTVYDLATGAKKLSLNFDEKYPAMSICAPAEGPYVYLHFHSPLRVDLKALLVRPMPTPRECDRDLRHRDDTGDVWRRMAINRPGDAPKLERFDGQSWLHDATHGVVLGTPRGSDAAELVGFDPVKHLETWRKPVAALAPEAVGHKAQGLELAEGRFFFSYSADEEHVVSVDAATGERQWEAVSPGASVMNLTVSPTRLYLVTLEWQALPVNVLDIRTGGLLARLGGAASRY